MDFKPEHVHYDIVEKWIRDGIKESHDAYFDVNRFDIELQRIEDKFIFHHKSLVSFVRNCMVPHIKRTSPKVKANLSKYIEQYIQGRTILSLAKEANYSPHLFSRYLVEALTQFKSKKLTDALRNPEVHLVDANVFQEKYRLSQITSNRLAREVLEAQQADPLHGPRAEVQRHMLGIEFECVLEYQLRQIGIGFDTEDQLRKIGTSRTPDVLLASPLAVRVPCKKCTGYEWKVICWIDSKALYGDIWTHNTSIISQAESYIHRFGPGLIMYWLGHAPLNRLNDANGQLVICGWQVPRQFMHPDGKFICAATYMLSPSASRGRNCHCI